MKRLTPPERLDNMVDFISAKLPLGLLFKKTLTVKFTKAKSSHGGQKKFLPYISIGLNNKGRYSNKEQWLERLKNEFPATGKVWAHARELAVVHNQWLFVEYSHVHDSPVIGGFVSDDPDLHMDAILAHELAHAVQFFCKIKEDYQFGTDFKAHQGVWKEIYRVLRVEFINHRTEQPMAFDHENFKAATKSRKRTRQLLVDLAEKLPVEVVTEIPVIIPPLSIPPLPKGLTINPVTPNEPRIQGAVAFLQALYSNLFMKTGRVNRAAAIKAGVEQGMNRNTCTTQWRLWLIKNNLK